MLILGGDRGKQDAGVVRPLVLSKPGGNFAVATRVAVNLGSSRKTMLIAGGEVPHVQCPMYARRYPRLRNRANCRFKLRNGWTGRAGEGSVHCLD